jgi:hypothetical protein
VLEQEELTAVADLFGVSEEQVERDHLISHVLADPSAGGRLSEDIDLWVPNRLSTATSLDERLPGLLRREFPRTVWDPPLRSTRSAVEPGVLVTTSDLRVRVQLLDHEDWARWPSEAIRIETRYSDIASDVVLRVPTLQAFAAMKTLARADRHAARDLYDLARLAELGALTPEAADPVRAATGASVQKYDLASLPSALDRHPQPAHQTGEVPSPQWCLRVVRGAYGMALGW